MAHHSVMPKLLASFLFFIGCLTGLSQEEAGKPPLATEITFVDKCIPESVKNLRPPPPFPFHKGLVTAVTTVNELAQLHTVQGLNHLHGGWEFEASRHFAIAMREDPECLMAHWGMVMCLLSPSPETDEARIAATDRLLHLISEGKGTDLERGFAYGIVKYLEEGPAGAAKAYRQVADKFPGEIQSEIFAALFGRGGYDDLGSITPTQESSEQRLQTLIEKNPDNALPLHALLLIRAEAPDLRPSLELARRLTQLVPDYAPYFHLLGHYEWRCGEHAKAASAFGRAVTLFSTWMKENKAAPADCGEWVRSECYRVVALASKGDFDNALAAAEKISNTSVDPKRLAASGTRQILWEAQTLPARILLRRSDKGDPAKALAALPSPEAGKDIRARSLSYWWVDGLRIAIEAQRLLDTGVLDEASKTIEAISFHGQAMAKRQTMGAVIGERSQWIRSFRALEVLASELRGRLALAGPPAGHGSAFNWFRAAADRQKPTSMLSPPAILTPMAMRLGDYYLARNQPTEAIAAYNEALANFPNDLETLERLQKAYSAGNQTEKAAETDAIIKSLAPEAE